MIVNVFNDNQRTTARVNTTNSLLNTAKIFSDRIWMSTTSYNTQTHASLLANLFLSDPPFQGVRPFMTIFCSKLWTTDFAKFIVKKSWLKAEIWYPLFKLRVLSVLFHHFFQGYTDSEKGSAVELFTFKTTRGPKRSHQPIFSHFSPHFASTFDILSASYRSFYFLSRIAKFT